MNLRTWENTDQKNSKYGCFLRSAFFRCVCVSPLLAPYQTSHILPAVRLYSLDALSPYCWELILFRCCYFSVFSVFLVMFLIKTMATFKIAEKHFFVFATRTFAKKESDYNFRQNSTQTLIVTINSEDRRKINRQKVQEWDMLEATWTNNERDIALRHTKLNTVI